MKNKKHNPQVDMYLPIIILAAVFFIVHTGVLGATCTTVIYLMWCVYNNKNSE